MYLKLVCSELSNKKICLCEFKCFKLKYKKISHRFLLVLLNLLNIRVEIPFILRRKYGDGGFLSFSSYGST